MEKRHLLVYALFLLALLAGYFLFLYATWNTFLSDRKKRDETVNALLDKIPAAPVSDATAE